MKRAFLRAGVSVLPVVVALGLGSLACGNSGSGGSGTGGSGGGDCSTTLKEAKNSEFCQSTPGSLDCAEVAGFVNQVCKVALPEPSGELQRSSTVKEYAGTGAPDVSCYAPASYPAPPGASQPVTVTGIAKIFSSGCESKNLKITFYKVLRGGAAADEGKLGDAVGTSVMTAADCKADVMTANDKCGTRYECKYSYPNVPSETELAVKTEGEPAWAPLIQYNIYIRNSEIVTTSGAPTWTHDVRALASDDYSVIPAVAIGGPVTAGHGVIAGEVHDCGDVRLINAVADVDKPRINRTYFTNNEDAPLPDTKATGTSTLGLYAAFDIAPGPVTVAAMGKLNGENVTLGQHHVYVYPDAVTSVTFKGLQPYQLPK